MVIKLRCYAALVGLCVKPTGVMLGRSGKVSNLVEQCFADSWSASFTQAPNSLISCCSVAPFYLIFFDRAQYCMSEAWV